MMQDVTGWTLSIIGEKHVHPKAWVILAAFAKNAAQTRDLSRFLLVPQQKPAQATSVPLIGPGSGKIPFMLASALKRRDRSKEAAPRTVWPLASPILAVHAGQGFLIRDRFTRRRQLKSRPADFHGGRRDDSTVAGAAAPFAVLRAAKAAARNPAVMSKSD
jgi:hypothetical protein